MYRHMYRHMYRNIYRNIYRNMYRHIYSHEGITTLFTLARMISTRGYIMGWSLYILFDRRRFLFIARLQIYWINQVRAAMVTLLSDYIWSNYRMNASDKQSDLRSPLPV